MKRIITILATFLVATCFSAQLKLTLENDALGSFGDNDYTHGTGLTFIDNNGIYWKAGQNMYAPSDLRRKDHIKGDRPYCGMIYGGVGYEFFKDPQSAWTHYGELDFGMIGPSARCKETQKFIHKILHCRDPQGWDNQLHDEFVVNAQWWTKYNWYVTDWFAVVPRAGVLAGTVQDAAELGCDFKIGYNMKKDVGSSIMFSAPKNKSWLDDLSCYAYVGPDIRYYLYNHILEGSMFGHKDDGLDVDIEPFVPELRAGAALQFKSFFVHYYWVLRGDEFEHQPNHPHYAGLEFGWTF